MMLYRHVSEMIGNTPLLLVDPAVHGLDGVELYAKLESANPLGSVKDRVAWAMVDDTLNDLGAAGKTLVEASSGNTAKALQILAGMSGVALRAYTNRIRVDEVRDLLRLLGTQVYELPAVSECPDPSARNGVFGAIGELLETHPGEFVHTSQYTNEVGIDVHYRGTGPEIAKDIGSVDVVVGGLGTTGSTRGTATYLREVNPRLQAVGVVSGRGDFIPGIRSAAEMWEVGLFQPEFYDEIVTVESVEAIDACLELAGRCGVLSGPTGAAAYAAAKTFLSRRDTDTFEGDRDKPVVAVFVVCDRLEPYLSYFRARRPALFGRRDDAGPRSLPVAQVAAAPQITVSELAAPPGPTLIVDVRAAMAYGFGRIPGSINMRDDYLDDALTQGIPFPADSFVIFVCASGEISARFAAYLHARGRRAASLTGGIIAWRDDGRPLDVDAAA